MKKTFIVIKFVSIMLTALFVHAMSTQATPIIYSVDTVNNRLVQIDLSGNITDVGGLGFSVKNTAGKGTIDLAALNGNLYGLQSIRGEKVVLHEINPLTGAASILGQLLLPGTTNKILHAEGLATFGGGLKIAYSPDGDFFSDVLADLSTGGIVSNATSGSFDFDGLGNNEDGTKMYGLDVITSDPKHTDFIGLTDGFNASESFADSVFSNPNDLIAIGENLLAIDHIGKRLHLIDLSTKILTSVLLLDDDAGGSYSGLASLEPVPEPTTVALLGVGLVGLAGAEVRRRRKKRAVDKR